MKRRTFLRVAGGAAFGMGIAKGGKENVVLGAKTERPNILWITCEDISPNLGCFGDAEARTPNLDKLASEGARYTNAFSVSGVCAPSRSCLITGMYPITLGTCHMRCNHTPPPHVRCFPAYLRDAGYYCTNNSKTDYQFDVPRDAWDECNRQAHWRNRPDKKQPFFAVFNFTVTHESQIGTLPKGPDDDRVPPETERHDPANAKVPPFFPDTPLIRRHWAHYYDLITRMDQQAGETLAQLEEDGFAENTLVFFYGDHGVGLPRAKRWLYDSGLHVPLILRWPGHVAPGSVSDRLVSFVDFSASVLSAAGVPIPGHMQGKAFLGGAAAAPRDAIYAARDRMDERYDLIRAVRDKRYKYIRNYQPYRPYAQYLAYPESFPVMQEMRRVKAEGKLEGPAALFFREAKPLEELFDTKADPYELNNLIEAKNSDFLRAESPEQAAVLSRLRAALDKWLDEAKDLGFVPETDLEAWLENGGPRLAGNPRPRYQTGGTASVFGRSLEAWVEDLNGGDPLRRLRAIVSIGLAGPVSAPILLASLEDPGGAVAFWGAVGLGHAGVKTPAVREALKRALERPEITAKLGAAEALNRLGWPGDMLDFAVEAAKHEDAFVRLRAVQILEEMAPNEPRVRGALEIALKDKVKYVARVAEHARGLPRSR